MRRLPIGPLALAALLAAGCRSNVPTSVHPLQVRGRQVVDTRTGTPVPLRGVAFTSGVWDWDPEKPENGALPAVLNMQQEADFAKVKGWGATAVTLYLNWYWFQTDEGWRWLRQTVDWCRKNDLYVIPSLVVYPAGGKRGGPAFWESASAQQQVRSFWREFELRYRDDEAIAGVDVLNEPWGAPEPWHVRAYELELIDVVRELNPSRIVFVEPIWGDPRNLVTLPRPNLVYVGHYYEPQTFTNQGWPWAWGEAGGIPVGIRYPGWQMDPLTELGTDLVGTAPAGTSEWRQVTRALPVPDLLGGEPLRAYFNVHSFGNAAGTAWFDEVEWALTRPGEAPAEGDWQLLPNGSFETVNEVAALNALYWGPWSRDGKAHAVRANDQKHGGDWSIRLQDCAEWCEVKTGFDGSYQITGGIEVDPWSVLHVRFWTRGEDLAAESAGVDVRWMRMTTSYWNRDTLGASLDELIVQFSRANDVPILVGEFSPSLVGPRPDLLNYTRDVIDLLDAEGVSWMFYPYRENWTAQRYLGLYNGARSATTDQCVEDTELVEVVRAGLQQRAAAGAR